MTSRTAADPGARVDATLRPVVEAAGFDLEQVLVSRVGRRSVVRVVVDSDDGISLDAVATVSRVVSAALDAAGDETVGPGAYTLEVTSPGVDRPLTQPRHWRRAVGRLVRTEIAGDSVEGRVLSADDAGVMLQRVGTANAAPCPAGYDELGPGTVQVEFVKGGPA